MSVGGTIRRALALWKGRLPSGLIPPLAPQNEIPRVIHQIFFTSSPQPLPAQIQENVAKIRRLNPDWSHRLYDLPAMVDFIRQHYDPRVLECFLRIDPAYGAARADLFRYLLLYKSGGVYLDIKSSMTRPLSEVLRPSDRYLLSNWRNQAGEPFEGWGIYPELAASASGEFQQWHIVAAPGHPFLRAVIERVLRNIACYNPILDGTGWSGVLRATGPIAYTLAIAPQLARHRHRIVDSLHDLGFQYSIYPHSSGHQALFSSHYANRTGPIVRLSSADLALSHLLGLLRRAQR